MANHFLPAGPALLELREGLGEGETESAIQKGVRDFAEAFWLCYLVTASLTPSLTSTGPRRTAHLLRPIPTSSPNLSCHDLYSNYTTISLKQPTRWLVHPQCFDKWNGLVRRWFKALEVRNKQVRTSSQKLRSSYKRIWGDSFQGSKGCL